MNKAVFAMLFATAMWGCLGIFTRFLTQCSLSPADITTVRMGITVLTLGVILLIFDRGSLRCPIKLIPVAIIMGVSKLMSNLCIVQAQQLIPLAYANILQFMYVFIIIVLMYLIFKEDITKRKILSAVFATFGCTLAVLTFNGDGALSLVGIACALGSAFFLSVDSIAIRMMYLKGAKAQTSLFYGYLVPAILIIPFADFGTLSDVALNVDGALICMVLIALMCTMIPYYLQNWSFSKLNVSSIAVLNSMEIVFVAIIGFIVFNEGLTFANIAGVIIIIGAVIFTSIDVGIGFNKINLASAKNIYGYDPKKDGVIKMDVKNENSFRDRILNASKNNIYKSLTNLFYEKNWQFETKSDYTINTAFMGDDLMINTDITVDDKIVKFNCILSLDAQEEHYNEILWKLNEINDKIRFGSFRLNPEIGKICFQYNYLFVDARPTPWLLESLVSMVVQTVDDHDGYLKKLANGEL